MKEVKKSALSCAERALGRETEAGRTPDPRLTAALAAARSFLTDPRQGRDAFDEARCRAFAAACFNTDAADAVRAAVNAVWVQDPYVRESADYAARCAANAAYATAVCVAYREGEDSVAAGHAARNQELSIQAGEKSRNHNQPKTR